MHCQHCGAEAADSAKFCTNCGAPLPGPNTANIAKPKPKVYFFEKPWFWIPAAIVAGIIYLLYGAYTYDRTEQNVLSVVNPIDADCLGCHIKYLRHEVTSSGGTYYVKIYYRFENKSQQDINHSFNGTVNQEAFQNGAELDDLFLSFSKEEEDADTEIRPGASIVVCSRFKLRNPKDDVEVIIKEDLFFSGKTVGTMILPIA